jgi:hypothetical protein
MIIEQDFHILFSTEASHFPARAQIGKSPILYRYLLCDHVSKFL